MTFTTLMSTDATSATAGGVMSDAAGSAWGTVPHRFTDLVALLKAKISFASNELHAASIPSHGDAEPGLIATIAAAHKLTTASKDLRSALSAYAHHLHVPRPKVASIAAAQSTTAQGLTRRYNSRVEHAVAALIQGNAQPSDLTAAFPSLTFANAERLMSGRRGEQSSSWQPEQSEAVEPSGSVRR